MEYRNIKILNYQEDEAIIIAQLNGQIVSCNTYALELYGYSSINDMRKYNLRDLMPEDFVALYPDIMTPEHLNINSYERHVSKRKHGELFACKLHTHYQSFDGEKLLVGHVQRVTSAVDIEKLRLQQNIKVLKRELEAERRKNKEKNYQTTHQLLSERYPALNNNDIKVCHYITLNYNSKQIAEKLNITSDGVFAARKRIRKKLKLMSHEDLTKVLLNCINSSEEYK